MGVEMSLSWIHESQARWDEAKAKIVGGAPAGVFGKVEHDDGALLPGEWFRVERDGQTVAFGWMDIVWGEGEMLLAVDPAAQGGGVGSFVIEQLASEAKQRGLTTVYNTVRAEHPDHARVTKWLSARGFVSDHGSVRLFRRT